MSDRTIDYYFTPVSPWAYLGHARFVALAARHGATVRVKPCDFGRIFAAAGGLPLAQRPEQRKSYRLLELARFGTSLGIPLNLAPRFFPVSGEAASLRIIVAGDKALAFAGAVGSAVWSEDRDIANEPELDAIAAACGLDASAVRDAAASDATRRVFAANTDEAIALQVFGAPTYVPNFGTAGGERFWGQDRLEALERSLAHG